MKTENSSSTATATATKLDSKKILMILPHYNFRDKEYSWLKERFDPTGAQTTIASTHLSEARGRFGTVVKPDVLTEFVDTNEYDAVVFVGEEAAANEYFDDRNVQRILETAFSRRKIVAAIGRAVPVLGFSGHLTGKKVTTNEADKNRMEELGAFYTGRLVEQDGDIITATGPYATREFADTIIKALSWSSGSGSGRRYLR